MHTIATNGVENNQYIHNFTDHLGIVRISYTDLDGSGSIDLGGEIVKERNYYPFGLQHQGYNNVEFPLGSMFKYGFGGKELQEENSIGWMDFGSRNYDAELGRWFNVDAQAERYHIMSPFAAMGNNPIMFVDPNGEELVTALVIGAVAGAIIGGAAVAIANPRADFGDIFSGAAIGAFSGLVTAGIGNLGLSAVYSAGAHGLFQGGLAAAQGGSFLQGAAIGAASSGIASFTVTGGPVAQMAMGAFTGGAIAEITGGNFVEGFATGLTVSALNHMMHGLLAKKQVGSSINEDESILDATVELKKIPLDKLEHLAIIPEEAKNNTDLIYPTENKVYRNVDGVYFSSFSDEKYWYKQSDNTSIRITYNNRLNKFIIKNTTSYLNPYRYHPSYFVGWKPKNESHWVLNPFDK